MYKEGVGQQSQPALSVFYNLHPFRVYISSMEMRSCILYLRFVLDYIHQDNIRRKEENHSSPFSSTTRLYLVRELPGGTLPTLAWLPPSPVCCGSNSATESHSLLSTKRKKISAASYLLFAIRE